MEDLQFQALVQKLGKTDPYLKLEKGGVHKSFSSICSDFSLAIHSDLIKTKLLDSSLLIRPDHTQLWNHIFQKYQQNVESSSLNYDLIQKFLNYDIVYPKNLSIDDILEFRKDKANVYFRRWLGDSISRIRHSGAVKELDNVLERDFRQLLLNYEKRMDNSTNLVSATLTGLGSVIADLAGAVPAAIAACVLPWFTTKLGSVLTKAYMERFSKDNWVLFFIDWKQNEDLK